MLIDTLEIKLFADGADLSAMLEMSRRPFVRGFTTNPSLMRKAGVSDYRNFAHEVLEHISDLPISFEVIADDFDEMEEQALEIHSWGANVYVKIPVTNTRGQSSGHLLRKLARARVKLNVTAVMTLEQVRAVSDDLFGGPPCNISVFAGRIADTGRDPLPLMGEAVRILEGFPNIELIWASPRELFNVFQANSIGCHIITATPDILKKWDLVGKDLRDYSLETVKMFYDDAKRAGYCLERVGSASTV